MYASKERFVFLLLAITKVTSLSLCETDDGYLEYDNKQDKKFVCGDIPATSTVTWTIFGLMGTVFNLSTCPPPTSSQPSTCITASFPPGLYVVSRIVDSTSFIIVNTTATSSPNSTGSITLRCAAGTDQVSCPVDYISRKKMADSACKVQFTNSSWSVSGQCNITKTFSGRGRYRCRIYESNEKQDKRLLHNATMPTISTGVEEVSGNCTFRSYLPPDGRYNYTAVIIPGEVEFPVVFTGSNEIRTPSSQSNHNCPNIVQEGQDIKCSCSVSDYGDPSGTLQWDNTGSTQLNLINVTKGDNGKRFACRLTWNNTDVWTVNYAFIVTYPSMIMGFKVNSNNVNATVIENSLVTLSCEADGVPAPGMNLINPSNQELSTVAAGNITADPKRELKYNFSEVKCDDSGTYTCGANNDIGKDTKSIMLLVQCSPRAVKDKLFQSVTLRDNEAQLQFNITAYPTPEVGNITYLGFTRRNVQEYLVSAYCNQAKDQLSSAICTVTFNNMTPTDTGNYSVNVWNSLGNLEFTFEVKIGDDDTPGTQQNNPPDSKSPAIGGIIGGVIGGIIFIALTTGVLVFCLRRKVGDKQPLDMEQRTASANKGTVLSMSPVTESEYENQNLQGETSKTGKSKGNGAQEAKRRNKENLVYTTVVFSIESTNSPPPPAADSTEYATIVGQSSATK